MCVSPFSVDIRQSLLIGVLLPGVVNKLEFSEMSVPLFSR